MSAIISQPESDGPMAQPPRSQVPLLEILRAYLRVGLTAFGMAVLQEVKALVLKRQWLTEEEMNEGLALVQLYPGPIMVDFTAYVGYKLRGVPGAILATAGFILPSSILMVFLSALYFAAASLTWVPVLFLGLESLVVGVIFNVTLDLGSRNIQGRVHAFIALVAFAGMLFKVNAVLIVLVALGIGAAVIRPKGGPRKEETPAQTQAKARGMPGRSQSLAPVSRKQWAAIAGVIAMVLLGVAFAWSLGSEVGAMGLTLFKLGTVAFGSGFTILPLIQAEVVDVHHWLTINEFADGIALGQVTPGPILITATFIGYKLGGVLGAALATFAIFSPSFAMTLVFSEVFVRVRDLAIVRGALAGVLAAFVGMLGVVILQLGGVALTTPATLALAASAFVAVRWFKLDIVWIFVGGLAIWGAMLILGAT
jgi:chromate transporter